MRIIVNLIAVFAFVACVSADDLAPYRVAPTAEDKAVQETIDRIARWTRILEIKNPRWVSGWSGERGGDCSGQMAWIMHKAGKKKFVRTTAKRMWSVWPGVRVHSWEDALFPDIIWFNTVGHFRHVGIVRQRQDYPRQLWFSHASSSRGFIRSRLKPPKYKKNGKKKDPRNYWGDKVDGLKILDLTVGGSRKGLGNGAAH